MANARNIEKTVTWIAAIIALTITVTVPALYFWTAHQGVSNRLEELAIRQAEIASKFVYTNGKLWQFNLNSLEATLREGETSKDRQLQKRRIFNNTGELLVTVGKAPRVPTLLLSAPISNGFEIVGRLEIIESIRPIWVWSAAAAVFGVVIGLILFVTLSVLPLRALNDTLHRLELETQERRRAENALQHAQKLESLGNFAGGIAHNLNNLLLPIMALSKLTLKDLPDESSGQMRLKKSDRSRPSSLGLGQTVHLLCPP